MVQWHIQSGIIPTNIKVKIDFTSSELSAENIMTWNCHVGESAKVKYDIILGRYLLQSLRINPK